jgi:uncharacterized protein DUF2252
LPRIRALLDKKSLESAEKIVSNARTKDSMQAFDKLTHVVDGEPQIVSDPPLIVPVEGMLSPERAASLKEGIHALLRTYRRRLLADRRHLLEDFRLDQPTPRGTLGYQGLQRKFDAPAGVAVCALLSCRPVNLEQVERRHPERLDALGAAPRAELLHVPDAPRLRAG